MSVYGGVDGGEFGDEGAVTGGQRMRAAVMVVVGREGCRERERLAGEMMVCSGFVADGESKRRVWWRGV